MTEDLELGAPNLISNQMYLSLQDKFLIISKSLLPVSQFLCEHACDIQVTCTSGLRVHETADKGEKINIPLEGSISKLLQNRTNLTIAISRDLHFI